MSNEKQLPLIFVVTLQLRNSGLLTWPSPGSVQLPSAYSDHPGFYP